MKVLLFNTWFRNGSTGKLVEAIYENSAKHGIDSYVVFGRGKLTKDDKRTSKVFKNASAIESKFNSVLSRFSGIMYGGSYFSTIKAIRLIRKINPDVIHIHCTNAFVVNNYKLFKYLGCNNYKVVITLHAEYLYTGSCGYALTCNQWISGCKCCLRLKEATRSIFFDKTHKSWELMYDALGTIKPENRRIVCVSEWLRDRCQKSKMFSKDTPIVIENGINTQQFRFYPDSENEYAFLKKKYDKLFLYVTPNFSSKETDIKGGDYFLKLTNLFVKDKNTLFIVAGNNTHNFDFSHFSNVVYFGNFSDQIKLAKLYSIADATLLLSRKETYSLVTAESISCGTKIIGFKCGGAETIGLKEYSKFFEFGDLESVFYELNNSERCLSKNSVDYYSDDKMVEKYILLYKDLFKE